MRLGGPTRLCRSGSKSAGWGFAGDPRIARAPQAAGASGGSPRL